MESSGLAPSSAIDDDVLLSLGLAASTSQYEYQGIENFLSVLDKEYELFKTDNTRSQFFTFHHLAESSFNRDFSSPAEKHLDFDSYFPHLGILLVKMPETETHAVASRNFQTILMAKLGKMNNNRLEDQLQLLGTACFQATDRTKRADESFRPKRLGTSRGAQRWPTLVIEVGYSEPYRKLKMDARWWLTASNNEVKNVLMISVNRNYREITIEQWIYEAGPIAIYQIVVSQEAGREKVNVTNTQPLVIPFSELFLRSPGHEDHDVVFDTGDLRAYANNVWGVQFEEDLTKLPEE